MGILLVFWLKTNFTTNTRTKFFLQVIVAICSFSIFSGNNTTVNKEIRTHLGSLFVNKVSVNWKGWIIIEFSQNKLQNSVSINKKPWLENSSWDNYIILVNEIKYIHHKLSSDKLSKKIFDRFLQKNMKLQPTYIKPGTKYWIHLSNGKCQSIRWKNGKVPQNTKFISDINQNF